MEVLLTKEEIKEINITAHSFPIFNTPVIQFGKKSINTVIGKSPVSELIMIYGNDDTGFQHIQKRHAFKYEYTDWRKNKPEDLDFPSVFPEQELLFISWQKIVDEVYKNENLCFKENKRKGEFDLFIGDYSFNSEKYKCSLLLYKKTKIIHTLFITEKGRKNKFFNKEKPKGFHFVKGKITGTLDFNKQIETLTIPYLNNEEIKCFQVDIMRNLDSGIEIWTLQFKKENREFNLVLREGKSAISLDDRMSYYSSFGLEDIEKVIGKINNMNLAELRILAQK